MIGKVVEHLFLYFAEVHEYILSAMISFSSCLPSSWLSVVRSASSLLSAAAASPSFPRGLSGLGKSSGKS